MQNASMKSNPKTPQFRRIIDALRVEITGKKLPEHAPLPSERTVADQYNVSRMTARRALEALVAEGLAYNEGRRGRFVSPARLTYDISKMVSLAANASADGTRLDIEILETKNTKADTKLSQALSVPINEPLYEYTRLFKVSDHPIFIETEFIIVAKFPDFLRHDLHQSTTQLLVQHYNTRAHTGNIVIRMRGVFASEAAPLGMTENQAAIELEQVISDHTGAPFCFGRQIWRGELAEFTANAIVNPHD